MRGSGSSSGLGGDPVEVGGKAAFDWDRDDLREFIGMTRTQRLFKRRVAPARGLGEDGSLLFWLPRPFRGVHRAAWRHNMEAGRALLFHQLVRELLGRRAIR